MPQILNNFFKPSALHLKIFWLLCIAVVCLHGVISNDMVNNSYALPGIEEKAMDFKLVADCFEAISQVSSRLEITRILAELFKRATPHEVRIISNLSLGLLRPPYEGTQFNVAEKSMIKVVAQLTELPIKDIERITKTLGDIGLVIAQEYHSIPSKQLTVLQVYKKLEEIEAISGVGSQEERQQLIVSLFEQLDPVAASYIARIIIGTLRLGFSDMTIIDALSWMEVGNKSLRADLEGAYNVCADIGLIAQTLKEGGITAIKHMHVHVGIPIRLAAAERMPDAREIFEKIGVCVAQPKLDGFRLQVHLDKTHPKKPIIKFFSRNLLDMSPMFPDLIPAFEQCDVKNLIVEGEAIVYDPVTGNFVPFQETVKRKRKHGIKEAAEELPLKLFLFDLLYLDDHVYINKPHKERRKKLESLVKNNPAQVLRVMPEVEIHSAHDLEDFFLENIKGGLEGIMVKKDDAVYQAGKRNFNWIKLKRIAHSHLEDTIDVVVLGYYTGSGKRVHFGIGAFLVGVYNPSTDSFQTVAKVGTGLKDEEWKELRIKCDTLKLQEKPINVDCAKELYPDVWVNPEIVCVVRADEITLSPLHSAGKTEKKLGFALRFPRFIEYSLDKKTTQTTTPKELARLYEDQYKK